MKYHSPWHSYGGCIRVLAEVRTKCFIILLRLSQSLRLHPLDGFSVLEELSLALLLSPVSYNLREVESLLNCLEDGLKKLVLGVASLVPEVLPLDYIVLGVVLEACASTHRLI